MNTTTPVAADQVPNPTVLTFGEALVGYASPASSLRSAARFTRFPGGADLNVAVGLTRLGVRTRWASVLGDDPHGDYLADAVAELGLTPVITRAAGPTALMFKAAGAPSDPQVLQVRHGSAFALHADIALTADLLALRGINHLHLTGIGLGVSPTARTAALTLLHAAVKADISISFDPNLRINLWPDPDEMCTIINTVAARATIVMPGLAEGRLLTGASEPEDIAHFYLSRGASEVVVKLGAAGAHSWTTEGHTAQSRLFPVVPLDTVGAGDGFAAGYLAGYLRGLTLQQRLDLAAAVGAIVTTRSGDLEAMPTQAEVDAALAATQLCAPTADSAL